MTDLAMFDAVNAVERGYRPYLMNFVVTGPTSKEAAAASAAASVLAGVDPSAAKEAKAALAAYLADIPDGVPKQNGIELGEAVAAKMLGLRADDGAQAPDTYAIQKGWLISEGEPPHSVCLTDDGRSLSATSRRR